MHGNEKQSPAALVLSFRESARLLKIDRSSTLHALIRAGRLRPVPWGSRQRIPLEQVQRLAREGFTVGGAPARAVSRARRIARPSGVGVQRIRDLEIEP